MSNCIEFDSPSRLCVWTNQTFWDAYNSTRKESDKPKGDWSRLSDFDKVRDIFWWFVPTDLFRQAHPDIVCWVPGQGARSSHTNRDWGALLLMLERIGCRLYGTVYFRDEFDGFKERLD